MLQTAEFIKAKNLLLPLARVHKCIALAGGDLLQAHAFAAAKPRWSNDTPEVVNILAKAATAPFNSDDFDSAWNPIGRRVFEALAPISVFGRLRARMLQVPFQTRIVAGGQAPEARFIGEAKTAAGTPESCYPVRDLEFSTDGQVRTASMARRKIGLVSVITRELARLDTPAAEAAVTAQLLRGLQRGLDRQFLDPARVFDADRDAPASIFSGAQQLQASGTSLPDVDHDLRRMIDQLVLSGMTLESGVWVMDPSTAARLSLLRDDQAGPAYPRITAIGGDLLGIPVISSASCRREDDSPLERFIGLVEADRIAFAADDAVTVEVSENAALQMDSTATGAASSLISLWQRDLAAIKTTLHVNWSIAPGAAVVLRNVPY